VKLVRGHEGLPLNKQLKADNLKADWAFALRAYGAGEPESLASLMHAHAPALWPPEVCSFLADVVGGIIKVNRRGKGKKSPLSLGEREFIAEAMAGYHALLREDLDVAQVAADHKLDHGRDLIDAGDVRGDTNQRIADFITFLAGTYGVSEAVIKKASVRLPTQ
jgi:hypothetical protein